VLLVRHEEFSKANKGFIHPAVFYPIVMAETHEVIDAVQRYNENRNTGYPKAIAKMDSGVKGMHAVLPTARGGCVDWEATHAVRRDGLIINGMDDEGNLILF
jgi:hypothetical protein